MTRGKYTVWCDGCGVEILWAPVLTGTRDYCCPDCLLGLVCSCGERMEMEERRETSTPGMPSTAPAQRA